MPRDDQRRQAAKLAAPPGCRLRVTHQVGGSRKAAPYGRFVSSMVLVAVDREESVRYGL